MPPGRLRDSTPSIAGYPLAIAGIVAAAFAVALLATTLPTGTTLPTLPRLDLAAPPDAETDPLPGVRDDVLRRILGDAALAFSPTVGNAGTVAATAGSTTEESSPERSPGPSPVRPRGALTATLAPGDWRIAPRMTADRRDVRPGEDITYTVTVTNIGTDVFRGDIALESHIPFRTSAGRSPECAEEWIGPLGKACRTVEVPVVGTPSGTIHEISTHAVNLTLAPSQSWTYSFTVTVDRTAVRGERILNHTHIRAATDVPVDTEPVEVTIV